MGTEYPLLLAIEDEALLRHLAAALEEFSYEVITCRDARQWRQVAEIACAPWVVVDETLLKDPAFVSTALDPITQSVRCCIVLAEPHKEQSVNFTRASAFVDSVEKPVRMAELLGKLRTCERLLTLHDSKARTGFEDATSFWLSSTEWCSQVGRIQTEHATVAFLQIDHFASLRDFHGSCFSERLSASVANRLRTVTDVGTIAAQGHGLFRLFTVDSLHEEDVAKWREEASRAAVQEAELQGVALLPTLSLAYWAGDWVSDHRNKVFERLTEGLTEASWRGGDSFISLVHDNCDAKRLVDETPSQSLFADCLVKHVMSACSLVVRESDSYDVASRWLRATTQSAVPVLSDKGDITAAILSRSIPNQENERNTNELVSIDQAPIVVDEETPLEDILPQLHNGSTSYLFATRKGRPVGLVTRNSLLAISLQNTPVRVAPYGDAHPWETVPAFKPLPDEV